MSVFRSALIICILNLIAPDAHAGGCPDSFSRLGAVGQKQVTHFPPSATEVETRLFAVHATDTFPQNGMIRTGVGEPRSIFGVDVSYTPRNTVHFSLGELVRPHSYGIWDSRKYAVVTPLKDLSSKLINVHPYDTFVLGDFKIPQGSIILVPRGTAVPEIPGVHFQAYDGPIRDAIDQVISSRGGWNVRMEGAAGSAMIGGVDASRPDFFSAYLKQNPALSFGTGTVSLKGDAGRLGEMEHHAKRFLGPYFNHFKGTSTALSTPELKLYLSFFRHQVNQLDRFFRSAGFPEAVYLEFRKVQEEYDRLFGLVETDLDIRAATGFTLQNAPQKLLNDFKSARADPAALKRLSNALQRLLGSWRNRIPLVRAKLDPIPPADRVKTIELLQQFASQLPQDEAADFVRQNWSFASKEEADRFWAVVSEWRDHRVSSVAKSL